MTTAIAATIWAAGSFTVGTFGMGLSSLRPFMGISLLLGCFAMQSSMEELIFRGWMLSAISVKFGVTAAVATSSAIFVFLHYDPGASWIFAINVFLFAVFACCWSLRAGSIWSAMGWHAGWNWALATGFQLRVTGLDTHEPALFVQLIPRGPSYLTGGAEGPEGSLACMLVLAAGIGWVAWGPRRLPARRST